MKQPATIRSTNRLPLVGLIAVRWHFLVASSILLLAGCSDQPAGQLEVSKFDVWVVPRDGSRIPSPRALSTADDDTVYALDNAGRVLVYSPDGKLVQKWHMPEHDVGRPEGVIRLHDGRVAVADTHYHRVVFFHPDGTVESMIGEKGRGEGQFVYPVAIEQDPHGFIYVGEYGDRQRIQKFTANGEFITQFGEQGIEPGQFQRPSGIIWIDGAIYTVDAFNNRIQVFRDTGEFESVLHVTDPEHPDETVALDFPYDIRATEDGRLFVVENKGSRITVLNTDGTLVGRYGDPGRGLGQFFNPWGLTVLSDGRILVADTGNHRIVELTPAQSGM